MTYIRSENMLKLNKIIAIEKIKYLYFILLCTFCIMGQQVNLFSKLY